MAYVIWRVFMKKYTRVRLGLHGSVVTPAGRHALTYDEESWRQNPDDHPKENSEEITRANETRQSKTKRVKDYLKKCKNALGSRSSSSEQTNNGEPSTSNTSSWYIDKQIEEAVNESEVNVLEDIFEDAQVSLNLGDFSSVYQKANLVEVKASNTNVKKSLEHSQEVIKKNRVESDKCVKKIEITPNKLQGNENASDKSSVKLSNPENEQEQDDTKQSVIKSDKKKVINNEVGFKVSEKETQTVDQKALTVSSPLCEIQGQNVDQVFASDDQKKAEFSEVVRDTTIQRKAKRDVASLVDKYFGSLYNNYDRSKKCLIRQARDLLVCEYRGCLQRFENEFCIQAAKLLQHLKDGCTSDGCSPSGWPLCLEPSGVVVHLSPLDPSIIRNRDCYLCVRSRSAPGLEVALIWRKYQQLHCHTIAEFRNPLQNLDDIMCSNLRSAQDLEITSYDDYDGAELPELLQNLLVSIEHAIERIPLDDLTFPCPQCLQYLPLDRDDETNICACQCSCKMTDSNLVTKKDSSIQTSPMFEYAGSIPHIDSDEDDDKESVRSGASSKRLEISTPKRIIDLPDKLLMSGINLPGTEDLDGRPIILCYSECITRAGLNKYEIAKLLLYYSSIPTAENKEKGFTVLLIAENDDHIKSLAVLDKAVCLISNYIRISRFLIWRPTLKNSVVKSLTSRVQTIVVTEENSLFSKYITKEQAPATCGGTCSHDQLEWVEFFKQLEPLVDTCRSVGQELVATLSQIRNEEAPLQVSRRFLNHQCRQISKALQLEKLQKLRKDGRQTLKSLEERSQWISNSKDVRRCHSFAHESFDVVEKVAQRLEKLEQERKERLKELARLRTLHDEAEELLSWIRKVGDDTLNKLTLLLRTAGDSHSVKDVGNEFEKFIFSAWRQVEKSNDLVEECKNVRDPKGDNLKELANTLHTKMKAFKEQLEETRVQSEDATRCFLLLESCEDILEDDNKEQDEFTQLAIKSGNEKLKQLCKNAERGENEAKPSKPPDQNDSENFIKTSLLPLQEVTASSTPIKSQNSQIRRRSVSSHAFIYHCNHHAAGELCNCCESDTENSVSYKLKKKYIQTLKTQGCICSNYYQRDTLERKNSATLDGIKEERESVEDLLEKIVADDCRRCDSGMSTADNSVNDESVYKKKLQRTCSCQYYSENCALCSAHSSSTGSNADQSDNQRDITIEEGSDCFLKSNSSDDIEEEHYSEQRRKVPPISANSHLYCHASTLDLPSDALYKNMDPKTQKNLKYIIREMIETERDYVKSLDYVIVNYIPELMREDIPQALRGQRNVVFGNVEKIYEFHSQHFLRELEECENNPLQVGQIFLKHNSRFYLYALYNKNKPKSDSLMSEYGSLFFKRKQIELQDKMDLASYLLKPVQRMGKYALLLQQMMKACSTSTSSPAERMIQEIEDLKLAEEMVRFQLRHGNDLLAMDSIRECDVNLKEQGRLMRQNEFLVWEGKSGKKSLRQVFLFEELILFSKARRLPDRKNLDLYMYKNSIKMTDIGLTARIGESPTKFEIWFRKRKPNDTFTLQSMSTEVKKAWTEELSQLLWKQAIKNRAVRMAEMSSMGIGNKPCLDIRPSQDQISDRSITFAQLSKRCSLKKVLIRHESLIIYEDEESYYADESLYNSPSCFSLFSCAAPRFRSSIASSTTESCRSSKRPHSVISMSSVSSSSTSSAGSGSGTTNVQNNSINLSFESNCESPKPYHRSATLNSQCSTESGIIADLSLGSDESSEQTQTNLIENQNY